MESLEEEHFEKTDEIRLKSNYGEDYLKSPRSSEAVTISLINEEHFEKTDEIKLKSNYGKDYIKSPRSSEAVTISLISEGRTTRTKSRGKVKKPSYIDEHSDKGDEASDTQGKITMAYFGDDHVTDEDFRPQKEGCPNSREKSMAIQPGRIKGIRTDFECTLCPYGAKSIKHILRHYKAIHTRMKLRDFKSDKCDFTTTRKTEFWVHKRTAHSKGRRSNCQVCCVTFSDDISLKLHKMSSHDEVIEITNEESIWDQCENSPRDSRSASKYVSKMAASLEKQRLRNIEGADYFRKLQAEQVLVETLVEEEKQHIIGGQESAEVPSVFPWILPDASKEDSEMGSEKGKEVFVEPILPMRNIEGADYFRKLQLEQSLVEKEEQVIIGGQESAGLASEVPSVFPWILPDVSEDDEDSVQQRGATTETPTLAEEPKDQEEIGSTCNRVELSADECPNTKPEISSPEIANVLKANMTVLADLGKIQATPEECHVENIDPHVTQLEDAEDGEIWSLEGIDAKITSVGSWLDQLKGKT